MSIHDDSTLMETIRALGISPDDLIAIGGEACVFRYGSDHVARVNHAWATPRDVEARVALLGEIRESAKLLPFALPSVERLESETPRLVTIEPRLPGSTLQHALRCASTKAREALILSALDAAEALGRVNFSRPWFGDLFRMPSVRAATWREYLVERARASLLVAGSDFAAVDPATLAAAFSEPEQPGFVHFDLYAGNFLVEGERVSALLDFGAVAAHGDPTFDLLSVAVYLRGEMTDSTSARDGAVCADWLRARNLEGGIVDAERWLAAMWSFAVDDVKLHAWCRRILLAQ